MATSQLKAPFPWYGGKGRIAPWIVSLLPPHVTYVEPFGGAASVLITKQPSEIEIYNDRDDRIVNFFRMLRDQPDALQQRLRLTPYARAEYGACKEGYEAASADPLEQARMFYTLIHQGFGAKSDGFSWGMTPQQLEGSLNDIERLKIIAQRLRLVMIENCDWRELFPRYDSPSTCFYLDPPYVLDVRSGGESYKHELRNSDHRDLVQQMLHTEGSVVLSGYDNEIYRPLEDGGFERFERPVKTTANNRMDFDNDRLEIAWVKDRAGMRLF